MRSELDLWWLNHRLLLDYRTRPFYHNYIERQDGNVIDLKWPNQSWQIKQHFAIQWTLVFLLHIPLVIPEFATKHLLYFAKSAIGHFQILQYRRFSLLGL